MNVGDIMKKNLKRYGVLSLIFAVLLSVLFGNNNVIALERTVDELIIYNQKPEVIGVTKVTKSEYPQFKTENNTQNADLELPEIAVPDIPEPIGPLEIVTIRFYGYKMYNNESYLGFNDVDLAVKRTDGSCLYSLMPNPKVVFDNESYNNLLEKYGFNESNLLSEDVLKEMLVLEEVSSYQRIYVYLTEDDCANLKGNKYNSDFLLAHPEYSKVFCTGEGNAIFEYFEEYNFYFNMQMQNQLELALVGGWVDLHEIGYLAPQNADIYEELGFESFLIPFDWRAEIYNTDSSMWLNYGYYCSSLYDEKYSPENIEYPGVKTNIQPYYEALYGKFDGK